jgi:Fe-S-cluster-containing dehydrogenase component/DMSO reductase anchor subunit
MNGLEEDESWRRVGTITIGEGSESRIGHVTTACHHCEDPGCLSGCPVKAYDKDSVTGIVRHLDDQCIGCKYCTMMCPYEVPRYSERLGVVRKCDMCQQRLSVGEAPACVQACPNEAISIQLVESTALATADRLAPGAPCSTITRPSTEYTSRHAALVAESIPQDIGIDDVAESHWPLAAMLIGTQVSVGMLVAERLAATVLWLVGSAMPIEATRINTLLAFVIGVIGLNIAPFHLGRPLRAWRVFLGLRTSWLSREAVVLGKYVAMLTLSLALLWLPTYVAYVPDWISTRIPSWAAHAALAMAVLLGVAGLLSSAMIYIVTRRKLWSKNRTLPRFFGTAATSGTACCGLAMIIGQAPVAITAAVLLVSITLSSWKLAWEWRIHLGPTRDEDDAYDRRSRGLASKYLAGLQTDRLFSGIAAAGLLVCGLVALLVTFPMAAMVIVGLGAVMQVAGESCERLLYFKSVVYDRMPGTLR